MMYPPSTRSLFLLVIGLALPLIEAQPGQGGGQGGISCSTTVQYTGESFSSTPQPVPLRGNVGCVDLAALALRDLDSFPTETGQDATANIYGSMEAGFRSTVPGMSCLGSNTVSSGIDTNLAEHIVEYICAGETIEVLDSCGGHALPYHYHERMTCLYESDPVTGHSTRIGTAGDGNGIYGAFIDGGVEPTDTDACGGRFGITPDSNGEVVYYYPITSAPPFSLGCYGPGTLEQCRELYDECGSGAVINTVTTLYGSGEYTLDCPCFDSDHSNVIGQGRPGFLAPAGEEDPLDNSSDSLDNSSDPLDTSSAGSLISSITLVIGLIMLAFA